MNTLQSLLSAVRLGEEQTSQNLTTVPILAPWADLDILPLPEALASVDFTVTEVEGGGSVPEVRVVNRLKRPVLLVEGEEILGALQNRVINSTTLVAPSSELLIPVSCSEQGRWQELSDRFADSGIIAPPSVRVTKAESVSRSLRDGNGRTSDQGAVWEAIDDIALSFPGPTGRALDGSSLDRQSVGVSSRSWSRATPWKRSLHRGLGRL